MTVKEKLFELYFTETYSEPSKKYFDKHLDEIEWLVTDNNKLVNGSAGYWHGYYYNVRTTSSVRIARCVEVNGFRFWIVPVTGDYILNQLVQKGWKRVNIVQLYTEIGD